MIGSVRGGLGSVRTAQNGDTIPAGAGGPWPGFGVTAPPAVAATSSLGSSGLGAQSDHTHAGVTSINGQQGALTIAGFPGYGVAPPNVASASAVGAATSVARSDHTHGLDLVAYAPSLAGMQATGVIQQSYSAPTATPAALNVATSRVPFGASGLLTTSPVLLATDTAGAGRFIAAATSTAYTGAVGSFHAVKDVAVSGSTFVGGFVGDTYSTASAFGSVNLRRWRGTFAAPAVVAASDILGQIAFSGAVTTLAQIRPIGFYGWVDPIYAVDATHVPASMAVCSETAGGTITSGGGTMSPTGISQQWTTAGDIVLGFYVKAPTDTLGYVYMSTVAGPPTGVPVPPQRWNGGATPATPFIVDDVDRRLYTYNQFGGAGWHYTQAMDYDPGSNPGRIPFVGATIHTLSDNANFAYDGFALNFGSTAATQEVVQTGNQSLFVGTGSTNATGSLYLVTQHTARVRVQPSGVVTVSGSGAAAPGGTYGDMVWNPALSRLTFGATGAPPAVGSMQFHSSTGSGISIGGGLTAVLVVSDSGGGGEASIAADTGFLGSRLTGYRAGGLDDLLIGAGSGMVLALHYGATRTAGSGTPALSIDGTSGALDLLTPVTATGATFSVTAATSIVLSSLAGSIVVAGDVLIEDPTAATAIHVTSSGVSTQTALSVQSTIALSQTQAAGAQALTIGNGPTATGGGAADIYFKIISGGNTYVVPGWQI